MITCPHRILEPFPRRRGENQAAKSRAFAWLSMIIVLLTICSGFAGESKTVTLAGWFDEKNLNETNLDQFMTDAEAIGFDALITSSTDPVFLNKAVEAGRKKNIRIFSSLMPMKSVAEQWSKHYPDRPVPWQVMSAEEEAARTFLMAGNNQKVTPYQFGGEPKMTNEVLGKKIIYFNNQECRELFKPIIDGVVSVPGIEGVAFDGFGYQNYHSCHCDQCQKLLADYKKQHPEMSGDEAEVTFFRDTLVDYINDLADYARSKKSDIKTAAHLWPVFAPDPLYGNRLNIDFCGQTAAWFTLWPEQKIAEYSRIISRQSKKYHPRQQGVGMMGFYDLPHLFPVKDAARVDLELKTMMENGCLDIQVCDARHVIKNNEVSGVFKKYFK